MSDYHCDFCDGGGVKYSRRMGASLNEPPYTTPCSHCKGSGLTPNNHWGSLDQDYIDHQEAYEED